METQFKNQSKQLGFLGPMFFKFWMMKTKLYNSIFINPNTICLLEFISTLLYLKAKMQHLLFLCCYWSTSTYHFGPLSLVRSIWSTLLYFGPLRSIQSTSVYFSPLRSISRHLLMEKDKFELRVLIQNPN